QEVADLLEELTTAPMKSGRRPSMLRPIGISLVGLGWLLAASVPAQEPLEKKVDPPRVAQHQLSDQPEPPGRRKKTVKPAEPDDPAPDKKPETADKKPEPEKKPKPPRPDPDGPGDKNPAGNPVEEEAKEKLGRISKNMRNSEERLAKNDPGDGTQQVQRDI